MDIRRRDKRSTRRKAILAAGASVLFLAGATGAGILVFSPSATAWPIAAFGQWNPNDEAGSRMPEAGSLAEASGTEGGDEAGEAAEGSLLAKIFGWLQNETSEVDTSAIAGAAVANAFESTDGDERGGNDEDGVKSGDGGENGENDVVLQVTRQDVDQAIAAGEEAVGFWRWLWDKIWGTMKTAAETVVSAVT